jgi:hypothetical protein
LVSAQFSGVLIMPLDMSIYAPLYQQLAKTPEQQAAEQALIEERRSTIADRQQKIADARQRALEEAQYRAAVQKRTNPQTGEIDFGGLERDVYGISQKGGMDFTKSIDDHLENAQKQRKAFYDANEQRAKVLGMVGNAITDQSSLDVMRSTVSPEFRQLLPTDYASGKGQIEALVRGGRTAEQQVAADRLTWEQAQAALKEPGDDATLVRTLAGSLARLTPDQQQTYLRNEAPMALRNRPAVLRALQALRPDQYADAALTEDQRQIRQQASETQDRIAANEQALRDQAKANAAATAQYRAARLAQGAAGGTAQTADDAKAIADAIFRGDQPPDLTGLYRQAAPVRAELGRMKYNLTAAQEDWHATQRYLSTLNSVQMQKLQKAINFTHESIPNIRSLIGQWDSMGLPILSAANLKAAASGAKGQAAQSLAVRLTGQVADLTSELGTVYKGGNSSTDESLKLAAQNLQADWSKKAAMDALDQIEYNLRIRQNSLRHPDVMGGRLNNPYMPEASQEPPPPMPNQGTSRGGAGVVVKGRDGRNYRFPDQQSADAFKKADGQ